MKEGQENLSTTNMTTNEPTIIQTDVGSHNGQNKCPKCGATEITLNPNTGLLRCEFCRHEFKPEKVSALDKDIDTLQGEFMGSGTSDIKASTNEFLTFKCSSCGSEVVIDASSASSARCHWCRNVLSINEQIPNGMIPDVVLPFNVPKEEAKNLITKFVGKRKFYAHPKFKQEFKTDNIMGVYFPYLLVSMNAHDTLFGEGEHLACKYTRGSGENTKYYYDADVYQVMRDFDISIHGLTIESSLDRLNKNSNKTNNIINAIMPFDIENCVKFNANFLKCYTSEKRDTNIDTIKPIAYKQAKDVAKFAVNDTLNTYDRGVAWKSENFTVTGELWQAAYLPVWLYSYVEHKGSNTLTHYVAVNARTKETMGSVPIHMPKLLGVSFLVEIIGILAMLNIDFDYNWLFLLSGIIYFIIIYLKYRNTDARHAYETETKSNVRNLNKSDKYVTRRTGLSNSYIEGCNNKTVNNSVTSNIIDSFASQSVLTKIVKDSIDEVTKK